MPTERKSPALELQPETSPIHSDDDKLYDEPKPIGLVGEINQPKELRTPLDLPLKVNNGDVFQKDGFYVEESIKGSTVDSTNGGAVVTRYVSQRTDSYGVFFIARRPCEVLWVSEMHVGTTAAITLDVLKGTSAVPAGVSVLASTFSLNSTAVTVVTKEDTTLSATPSNRRLAPGDWLFLQVSAAPTATTEVFVQLYLKYLGTGEYI